MSAAYVYALAGAPMAPETLEGHRLEAIDLHGIHAIVEARAESIAASEDALRAQHRIVEAIAARIDPILPARFGTFVEMDELRRVVELRSAVIREALELVRGRRQMTLRITGLPPRLPGSDPPPSAPATGTDYLHRRKAAVSVAVPAAAEPLRRALSGIAVAERIPPPADPTRLTIYHLIDAAQGPVYRREATAAAARGAVSVQVSGPWPAFAFAPELIA